MARKAHLLIEAAFIQKRINELRKANLDSKRQAKEAALAKKKNQPWSHNRTDVTCEAIAAAYQELKTKQAVAEKFSISVTTVNSRLAKADRRLRR